MSAAHRVVVLIDGSNVARTQAWRALHPDADDHDVRRRLVDAVSDWAALHDHDATLVFDGAGPWAPGQVRITPRVVVEGSGAGSGDAVLERAAAECHRRRRTWWLVSSDGELRQVAGARADRVIQSDEFVAELVAPAPDEHVERAREHEGSGGSQLRDSMSDSVLERLEQLRRGEL